MIEQNQITINKIYYCIHPLCWTAAYAGGKAPAGSDPLHFLKCLEWERQARHKQEDLIANLKPDEALVLYPIGETQEMKALETFAEQALGRRCLVLRCNPFSREDLWREMPDAIRAELADEIM